MIEEAYKEVLANYPDCYATKDAAYQLAEMKLQEGDKTAAIQYYRLFLEKVNSLRPFGCNNCKPGLGKERDGRVAIVTAKLAELEGTSK